MKIFKHRDDDDINIAIEAMIDSMDEQDDPYVGIFWYDEENNELFGVDKQPASDRQFYNSPEFRQKVKTGRKLHETIWKKEFMRKKDKRFKGDYTQVPRGRVFQFEDGTFVVFTGDWIKDRPQVKSMILEEFDLPEDATTFKTDIHWQLGHGWSTEF